VFANNGTTIIYPSTKGTYRQLIRPASPLSNVCFIENITWSYFPECLYFGGYAEARVFHPYPANLPLLRKWLIDEVDLRNNRSLIGCAQSFSQCRAWLCVQRLWEHVEHQWHCEYKTNISLWFSSTNEINLSFY
jgi:hypothetical protein